MRLARGSDLVLGLFVIAIAALLLVSIPTPLLDVLIVLNIALSLLLLAVSLYVPNSSALLTFPSLLLLTTLFRLGLNVASTRLILLDGYAGEVIQSFGLFLVQGEVVVGIIIFSIITIVNFVVIARGSSRVAEVAARFALDALPGKQMAIEADMRAGLISAFEANQRRDALRKESQLYGNMDGAMKFVQGDAIAGFIIIFTNILGGIYRGVSQGSSFGEALQTYTILTIGDGLVSQIPALLISICAGIVITRISSSDDSTLGSDVGEQLLGRPGALYLAGSILVLMGLFPDLPIVPFWAGGFMFISVGFLIQRGSLVVASQGVRVGAPNVGLVGSHTSTLLQLPDGVSDSDLLVFSFESEYLAQRFKPDIDRIKEWWPGFRDDFERETGVRLPDLGIRYAKDLPHSGYSVSYNDLEISRGKLKSDLIFVSASSATALLFGLKPESIVNHPISGASAFWLRRTQGVERLLSLASISWFSSWHWLGLTVASFFLRNPEELLTLSVVQERLKFIERNHPALMQEVFGRKAIDASRLAEILQVLVREGASVHNLKQILEHVAAFYARSNSSNEDFDAAELITFLRQRLRRSVLGNLVTERNTLKAIQLSVEVEHLMEDFSVTKDAIKGMAVATRQQLVQGLRDLVAPIADRGVLPVVILCSSEVRPAVSEFILQNFPGMPVVASAEVDHGIMVEVVSEWIL